MRSLARLARLYRYPVEPLQGEELDAAIVTAGAALPLDRVWVVQDADSGVRLEPHVVGATAYAWSKATDDGQICVEIPGADRLVPIERATAPLSVWLGRRVHLAERRGEGVVVTTTSTLRWLAQQSGQDSLGHAARRIRPHLVVDSDAPPFREFDLVGAELTLGEVTLRVTGRQPLHPGFAQAHAGAPAADRLLQRLPENARAGVALLAEVMVGGTLHRDAAVVCT